MKPMIRYTQPRHESIDRAFRHHSIENRRFVYHGVVTRSTGPRGFRVVMDGELFELSHGEAWLVAVALASGRETGRRLAVEKLAGGDD